MTRMIERWFPCDEVSAATAAGWGLGRAEKAIFTWFAARPPAQAKAAMLTSLLTWPEDTAEQSALQELVRKSLAGRFEAWVELQAHLPHEAKVLDPFSGRGIIPLEAARLGISSRAVDYAPLAVLASYLLIDYPFRDWSAETRPEFGPPSTLVRGGYEQFLADVEAVLREVGSRHEERMSAWYPAENGVQPWGYLWARTIPCQECGNRFPLVGSYELRKRKTRKAGDIPAQSFHILADRQAGSHRVVVHEGPPRREPTLVGRRGGRGKAAVCPYCDHVHDIATHQRMASDGLCEDELLVVADSMPGEPKTYRLPTPLELDAANGATSALRAKPAAGMMSAVPNEAIPLNNGATIRPELYGAVTYGDLMCDRQTLSFVTLAEVIRELGEELIANQSVSLEYTRALIGYCLAQMARKIKYSTRGATLYVGNQQVDHIYVNESTVAHSYDFFEVGLGGGAGSWDSLVNSAVRTLKSLQPHTGGIPSLVERGSATNLPFASNSFSAVVTDPPYDAMVYYSDASDLLYVWLKRAMLSVYPELAMTADPNGLQEKSDEIIVKDHGRAPGEHRDRDHYDKNIGRAFAEMRRVVADDGVVTIVFGHGEPEVWRRLLSAMSHAGLVMTGSWPSRTEAGGQQGKANIETTLTMCCRPAIPGRPAGRRAAVESAVKREVRERMALWSESGLAPTDMLMASAGPAMEVVGRYSHVLDARGEPVELDAFLPIARQAVQEAEAIEIDHHPLETFDARTRFALWWVRLFGRNLAPKSELRWQVLASSLDLPEVRDLVPDVTQGCQFVEAKRFNRPVEPESSVIDVALRMAKAWADGLDAVGGVLADAGRDAEDAYLWAAISFLADRLPDSDPDAIAWTGMLRNRRNVGAAARGTLAASERARRDAENESAQGVFEFTTEPDEPGSADASGEGRTDV